MSISLIGHESFELIPVGVFSFRAGTPKIPEFSFSEKSLWFKGPLVEVKQKPGMNLLDIWDGKSSGAASWLQAASGGSEGGWSSRDSPLTFAGCPGLCVSLWSPHAKCYFFEYLEN